MPIPRLIMCLLLCAAFLTQAHAEDLGNLSANPFDFNSTANPFGQGSPFAPNEVNNLFSPYGSPSAINQPPTPSPPMRRAYMTSKETIAESSAAIPMIRTRRAIRSAVTARPFPRIH